MWLLKVVYSVMDYVCEDCGTSFSRSYNMLRHKKESCMARFANRDIASAKQRRIDGTASTSRMINCVTCNVSVPSNQMTSHKRTSNHRNMSCLPLSPGIQIVESAFKSRIVTYRISSENEHIDYPLFFEEIKPKVINAISDIVSARGALKINMVVTGRYLLPTQDVISEKSFNTCNEIVTLASDLDYVYGSFVEAMKVQSTEFQEKDSGMLLVYK